MAVIVRVLKPEWRLPVRWQKIDDMESWLGKTYPMCDRELISAGQPPADSPWKWNSWPDAWTVAFIDSEAEVATAFSLLFSV